MAMKFYPKYKFFGGTRHLRKDEKMWKMNIAREDLPQ
jgi:hypothetical protein